MPKTQINMYICLDSIIPVVTIPEILRLLLASVADQASLTFTC